MDFCPREQRRNKLTGTAIFVPERKDDGLARDQGEDLSMRLRPLQDGMASVPNHDLDVDGRRLGRGVIRMISVVSIGRSVMRQEAMRDDEAGPNRERHEGQSAVGDQSHRRPLHRYPCLGFTTNISPCRTSPCNLPWTLHQNLNSSPLKSFGSSKRSATVSPGSMRRPLAV